MTQPEYLYHYTSAAGLAGIFSTKKIWMTYIHSLNDSSENSHAFSLIIKYLKERHEKVSVKAKQFSEEMLENGKDLGVIDSSGYPSELGTLTKLINQLTTKDYSFDEYDIFTFSLSKSKDSLSQWRGYGSDGGYSIEFDLEALQRLCSSKYCTIKKCVYDTDEQKKIINDILDEFFDGRSQSRHQNYCPSRYKGILGEIFNKIRNISPLFKHSSFEGENEWRIIFHRDRGNAEQFPLLYRTSNEYITPYIELALGDSVNGIMIGPGIDFERAKQSLTVLVKDKKSLNCDIENISQSKSPYRL